MADYKEILYTKQRGGVLITLNRPEALNAITNIGGKAASLKEKLAALPRKAKGGPARVSEYPTRLFIHLLGENEKE